jgi:hypothetical protein
MTTKEKRPPFFGNKNLRSLHRDIGYIFVGMIIAFSVSGIALNHRTQWNPVRYLYELKKVPTSFHLPKESVTRDNIKAFSIKNKLGDFQSFNFSGDSTLGIYYKSADATIDLVTGKCQINIWRDRPILAQLYSLHSAFSDDNWYKYYSDVFGLGLIFISLSGMFLMRGKYSFRKRGWWLALAGTLIPLLSLFLFY